MSEIAQATPLIPDFTLEDFLSEAPYAFLYQQRDNRFLLQIMVEKLRIKAKELGFGSFIKTWNEYLKSQKQSGQAILGQNDTMFPGQPLQLRCGSYVCDEDGIRRYSEIMGDVEVLSHPLMPVRRVINLDDGFERMQLSFSRGSNNAWRTITAPKEMISSSQKIVGLSKSGIGVTSENAKDLVKYLSDIESLNYDELPQQSSISHMGWLPDGRFAPYAEDIVYDGESPEFARMYKDFQAVGSEETWMDLAKQVRRGKSIPARMALAASFAAPLIQFFQALPFFVHFWGTQGCGKTVGLMLAASVWGNPSVGGYIKTFGGTKVSHEIYASFCCNMPILLDELQVISDRRMFDDIIYMLCEGVSKGRGAKDGGLQLQRHWSSCILTTGEMPIVQSNSGGGAAVRTIEVNYGGEPFFEDARSVAQTLKANYGWAGRKFIQALGKEKYTTILRQIQKKFYDALSGEVQDKQVLSASILLAADSLATACIFQDKRALTVEDVRPYLVTQEEADVNGRCYDWLIGFIGTNPRRFDPKDENIGEFWGEIKDGTCYIIKNVFERALRSEGYSPGAFLTWAKRKNLLKTENNSSSKNHRLTYRRGFGTGSQLCYAVLMPSEDGSEPLVTSGTASDAYTPVHDPDLPF